jgi:hypothetical protein
MKKLIASLACVLATFSALAQGTINFNNFVPPGIDAPIFDVNGTTRLAGNAFMAQLWAGPSAASLAPIGAALPFFSQASGGAGYIDSSAGPTDRTVGTVAPGAIAFVQVRAWSVASGVDWNSAGIRGQSSTLQITTGGAGSPPSLPADLTGLTSFSLAVIPEPSVIALGLLGAGALLLRRRK